MQKTFLEKENPQEERCRSGSNREKRNQVNPDLLSSISINQCRSGKSFSKTEIPFHFFPRHLQNTASSQTSSSRTKPQIPSILMSISAVLTNSLGYRRGRFTKSPIGGDNLTEKKNFEYYVELADCDPFLCLLS